MVRKLLLFSTYFFCVRKGLDWLDVLVKRTLLFLICPQFQESSVWGFALLEDRNSRLAVLVITEMEEEDLGLSPKFNATCKSSMQYTNA